MKQLKEYIQETDYCTYCPMMCRFACPVVSNDGIEAHAPGRLLALINLLRTGELKPNEDAARIFYQCTECLHCNVYCKHDISPSHVLRKAKEAIVSSGFVPETVKKARENLKASENFFGIDLHASLKAVVPEEFFRTSSKLLYFIGCVMAKFYPSTVFRGLQIFNDLGKEVSLYPDPVICCGYPYLALGDMTTFKMIASRNMRILDGYDEIVCPCPSCVHTIKEEYRQAGYPVKTKVIPLVSYLLPFVKEGILSSKPPQYKRLAFHDPCFLGRYLNIYEEPREILRAITQEEVLEPQWKGRDAVCCGAGGVFSLTSPDTAKAIALERIEEFRSAGADAIVTACPTCQRWLGKTDSLKVMDIIDLLHSTLLSPKGKGRVRVG